MNPLGKGGYELLTLKSQEVNVSIAPLKEAVVSCCEEDIEGDKDMQFGYVVPGHGKKGKHIAILSDADVRDMYTRYEKKSSILLWAKQCRKRPKVKLPSSSSHSNYDS